MGCPARYGKGHRGPLAGPSALPLPTRQVYAAGPYDYGSEYYWCGPYWHNPLYPYWGFGVGAVVLGPRWWGHHRYVHGGYWHGHYRGGGGYHGGFHGGGGHHR